MEINIIVEDNFCERLNRQLIIKCGDVTIQTEEFSSNSDRAKEIALKLQRAVIKILYNHTL
jgi:hypothetical protein